jgi:hypothetical protein
LKIKQVMKKESSMKHTRTCIKQTYLTVSCHRRKNNHDKTLEKPSVLGGVKQPKEICLHAKF